ARGGTDLFRQRGARGPEDRRVRRRVAAEGAGGRSFPGVRSRVHGPPDADQGREAGPGDRNRDLAGRVKPRCPLQCTSVLPLGNPRARADAFQLGDGRRPVPGEARGPLAPRFHFIARARGRLMSGEGAFMDKSTEPAAVQASDKSATGSPRAATFDRRNLLKLTLT